MGNKFKDIDIKYCTFSMTWSIWKILIQIKSRLMKSHNKIFLFITLATWHSKTLDAQKLIV